MPRPYALRQPHPVSPFEPLEDRRLLAGVTLVTHGQDGYGPWLDTMAATIISEFVPDAALGRITIDRNLNVSTDFNANPAQSSSAEAVIVLDWADAAGGLILGPTNNTFQIATTAVQQLLRTDLVPGFGRALAAMPLHLIGFSRGGSVVSEMARELGRAGIWVDQVTTLDPHPRGGDAPVGTPSTVAFADNYRQTLELTPPFIWGKNLGSMAYNRTITSMPGGYSLFNFNPSPYHSNVHLWYQGTIDTLGDAPDGEFTLTAANRSSWYAPGESLGANAGFAYSRLALNSRYSMQAPAGMDRLVSGVHPDLGGTGTRQSLSQANAFWPNILRVSGPGLLVPGRDASFRVTYAEPDSHASISLQLDLDTNPYNGNEINLGATAVGTTNGLAMLTTVVGQTTQANAGTYRLLARITDGTSRERVAYASGAVQVASLSNPPATALVVGSGAIGDDGSPLVYELRDDNVWYVLDLVDAAGSSDPNADPADSIATWTDGVDGTFFAAVTTGDRVYLYERSSADASWTIRDLTGEITGSRGIISNVVILQRSSGDTDIAGLDSDGDLIVYSGKPSANSTWTFTDIADTFLRPNGRSMPEFTGRLVSYTTSWNARTIAGLNASGQLEAVWTAQNLTTWLTSNLSTITGAPTLSGGLSVFLTSWNAINIVGLNPAGNVIVSWWVPSFGGAWRQNNFTTQFGASSFQGTELTTWVTPWRALNIAGVDNLGNINVFWWVPGGSWNVANLTQALPGTQARPESNLSSATGTDQSLNIFGVDDETGDTIRLFWKPAGAWALENLTDIALLR